MNLAKYLKGSTTIRELEEMPNSYIHTIYKQYVNMLQDEKAREAQASEEAMEEMTEAM